MTTQDVNSAGSGFGSTIRAALEGWKRRRLARHTISTLHGMSDHQLKDIGVFRCEINHRFYY